MKKTWVQKTSKKIKAILVIPNVVSYAVRVNEINSSYKNWQLEDAPQHHFLIS